MSAVIEKPRLRLVKPNGRPRMSDAAIYEWAARRMEESISKCPMSGCWIWTGSMNSSGYGRIFVRRKGICAHRFVYEHLVGPIPQGMDIDHLCRVRACVNPAHLEPVTRQVNLLRGETLPAALAKRTHCINGHAFSINNTRLWKGTRICRACDRDRARTYAQRRAA